MSTDKITTEWGVKHADGSVEKISEASANEGYMDAQQYATVRADVTPGAKVVKRTRKIVVSDWTPGRRKPLRST